MVAFETAPGTLDPRYGVDAYGGRVRGLVFASLLRVDETGSYRPWLAESWACEADRTACRFVVRDDARFHDGSPVTPADVLATYRSVFDPASASPRRAALEDVTAITLEPPRTIRFDLERASPDFEESSTLGVMPASIVERSPNEALDAAGLIGAGPYRIDAGGTRERVYLAAHGAYFDGRPAIERIEIRTVPDALMRAMELRHGSVHLVQNAIEPDTVQWLEENAPHLQTMRARGSNFQYLGFNMTRRALADVRVRRAIAYAIDRDSIVDHLLAGHAQAATGLLPPDHWSFSGDVRRYRHDPARAKALLDAAGYTDPDGDGPAPRLTLGYKTTTHALRRRIAEAMAEDLARVGIELDVRTYEWGTFFADIKSGNFDLYSLQWVGIVDPDLYRQVFHSKMTPPEGKNRNRFSDKRMDKLTRRGARLLDAAARKDVYRRVQKHAARRLPYVSLWWPERVVVASTRLSGFAPHPAGSLLGLASARFTANPDGRL